MRPLFDHDNRPIYIRLPLDRMRKSAVDCCYIHAVGHDDGQLPSIPVGLHDLQKWNRNDLIFFWLIELVLVVFFVLNLKITARESFSILTTKRKCANNFAFKIFFFRKIKNRITYASFAMS